MSFDKVIKAIKKHYLIVTINQHLNVNDLENLNNSHLLLSTLFNALFPLFFLHPLCITCFFVCTNSSVDKVVFNLSTTTTMNSRSHFKFSKRQERTTKGTKTIKLNRQNHSFYRSIELIQDYKNGANPYLANTTQNNMCIH